MIICTKISVHFIAEVKMQKNAKSIIYYPKAVNRPPKKQTLKTRFFFHSTIFFLKRCLQLFTIVSLQYKN